MNILKKFFLINFILLFAGCDLQNSKQIYRCEEKGSSANTCEYCKLDKEFKFQFVVSKESNSVMQIIFFDGLQTGSITHKNCTIFSDKNWDCSQDFSNNPRTVVKMSNGKLTSYTEWNHFEERNGICTK